MPDWSAVVQQPFTHPHYPEYKERCRKAGLGSAFIEESWSLLIRGLERQAERLRSSFRTWLRDLRSGAVNVFDVPNREMEAFEKLLSDNKQLLMTPQGMLRSTRLALWSGGISVSKYVRSKGHETIESTLYGKILDEMTNPTYKIWLGDKSWGPQGKLWNVLSAEYVRVAAHLTDTMQVFMRTHDLDSVLYHNEITNWQKAKGRARDQADGLIYHILLGMDSFKQEVTFYSEREAKQYLLTFLGQVENSFHQNILEHGGNYRFKSEVWRDNERAYQDTFNKKSYRSYREYIESPRPEIVNQASEAETRISPNSSFDPRQFSSVMAELLRKTPRDAMKCGMDLDLMGRLKCGKDAIGVAGCPTGCFQLGVCGKHRPQQADCNECGAVIVFIPLDEPIVTMPNPTVAIYLPPEEPLKLPPPVVLEDRPDFDWVDWLEQYDHDSWCVPAQRDGPVFQPLMSKSFKLGSKDCVVMPANGVLSIVWGVGEKKPVIVPAKDYKSRDIYIPDARMWSWWMQRKITRFTVAADCSNSRNRVVFGTKEDKYTEYPEKYGFISRRAISSISAEWEMKEDTYEKRLKGLNPQRGQAGGKWKLGANSQNRMDEISEESALRIKHAPAILLIHRYIKTHDDFIWTYLAGSRGDGTPRLADQAAVHRARPDHITDHEIYRMFAGKHRKRILDNAMFADHTLDISQVGKKKNRWYNKNQVSRWRRVNAELNPGKNQEMIQATKELLKK